MFCLAITNTFVSVAPTGFDSAVARHGSVPDTSLATSTITLWTGPQMKSSKGTRTTTGLAIDPCPSTIIIVHKGSNSQTFEANRPLTFQTTNPFARIALNFACICFVRSTAFAFEALNPVGTL